ncbi:MAG: transporter, DctM subunit [Bacillota bacterium]|jgi:C4-dicarboxylate transporter DctM subunit|nr:transporter, DctM subunit [Bacillota bacterium]
MTAGTIFLSFFLFLAISIPVASSIGLVSILPGLVDPSFPASATYVIRAMMGGVDSFPLLAIPMFVLSGIIMAKGGVSKKLFEVFAFFIGKFTAGMPCAVIVTCLFYGAISGSSPATVAAVGSMTVPVLVSLGYDVKFSTALVAVAGGLGVIIPPSIPFILYGMASGASIGDMFTAGILPGLLIAACLMCYAFYYCKKHGEDKEKINETVDALRKKGLGKVLLDSSWALLTPVIILGSIYSGVASPTEAAVLSVFYALIVSLFIYKTLTIKEIPSIFSESVRTFGPMLFILAAAFAFARILALMNVPQSVSLWITSTFTSKAVILLVVNVFLLLVGMVMDGGPAILILTPIMVPIMNSIGVDLIHFGLFMVVNLAIGFVTPPVGINLFVASSITKIPVMDVAKHATPFILLFLVALALLVIFPQISLVLL